ncbi:universal stress protein [Tenacibaculum maritimum]|uniref:universal stress protein n=1 Tax=Tenacibaculum maritimum TaxID=107401 RepID=UPI0003FE51C5|nr:universal stress protein [Tenacibaculum maritimum]MCD9563279.1 universal stress protein [Tenacibaculum maritimum]MCD9566422.1 universal stress protein [Tenacibaculum maritimum]MCD9579943.1 universal stress protein [Tenacibaculum maritimum]MCD9584191.1 universal stress protein [Tenacibaculum maritimum]MCD9597138.1 universal stress protein [Tenacibaculum maritimum]
MKKIIVPVDFSKHSEYALKAAALLAKKNNSEVYVLHMLDLHEVSMNDSGRFQQEKAAFFLKLAEKKFKDFLKKDFLKEIHITPIIKHFKVFSEINEIADKEDADLIIMGSHGVSGMKEFFIGSNTEKVVRHAKIPVLIVKKEYANLSFDDVVFASDFSERSVASYKKALKILKGLESKMHLLYVNTPNENFKNDLEMEQMAAHFLNKAEGNLERLDEVNYVCDYSVEKGVLNFANSIGANLIAVSTHGRKGLSHIFRGSVSEDLANHSSLPIITFKM